MAFNILSSNEIELLTEDQRKSYEKELAIYKERVKFVEQMERFENAVITPYEPKLVNISDVGKAPEKIYLHPEYVINTIDIDVKSAPKTAAIHFDKPVTVVVPKYSKPKNISVEHIKKPEQDQPVLPQIGKTVAPITTFVKPKQNQPATPLIDKAVVPIRTFIKPEQDKPALPASVKSIVPHKVSKKIEQVRPNLPTPVKLQNFVELAFASVPVSIDREAMKVCNLNITPSAINLSAFTLPEKTQPVLPQSSVKFSEVKAFKISKKVNPVLPKSIIPNPVYASFNKPNMEKVEMPTAQKAVVPTKKFVESEYNLSDLPMVGTPKVEVPIYIAPKFKKSALPIFTKPVVASGSYFKLSVHNTPKIEHPSINVIAVKPFKKVDSKISGFPSVGDFTVPDAYANEFIKHLLPSNKK